MSSRPVVFSAVPTLFGADGELCAACGDGGVLRLLSARNAGGALDLDRLAAALAARPVPLG